MTIQINIGDKPGISCCLISCAALAQNTSTGVLWLFLGHQCHWTGKLLLEASSRSAMDLLSCWYYTGDHAPVNQWWGLAIWCPGNLGSFCHFASVFFSVHGPVTPSAMGMVTSVLLWIIWPGSVPKLFVQGWQCFLTSSSYAHQIRTLRKLMDFYRW